MKNDNWMWKSENGCETSENGCETSEKVGHVFILKIR